MANSRIRAKVRRRKVAHLAAYSRQFTVNNNTIPKSKLNQSNYYFDWDKRTQFGKFEVNSYGHLFTIDKDGHYHLEDMDCSWSTQKHKQPERLHKRYKKKYYFRRSRTPNDNQVGAIRKIVDIPSTFPKIAYKKMTQQEYWEKLVEHKLAKWERKNPKPAEMFTEDVEKWEQQRETAKERFRDVVVSMYDKLLLTGRFKMNKEGQATYQEKEVAKLKDIDGYGHHVNQAPKDSKLIRKAQETVDMVKTKRHNLVCGNLRDHKRQKGRIILPQAALKDTLAIKV